MPLANDWEANKQQPELLLREAIAVFGGLRVPKIHGGLEASATTIGLIYQTLAAADIGFAFSLVVHNNLVYTVATSPNQLLRDKYLAGLMKGDLLGSFLLTEPDVGSDATRLKLRAEPAEAHYLLSGEKAWIVNGINADLLLVFGQTKAGSRSKGIAAFLVEAAAPGIERGPSYELFGGHSMGSNGIRFTDCRVAAEQLIFPAGAGFQAAMQGIDYARFSVAAMCNGALNAGLSTALTYANERRAFTQPIINHQGLQFQLADVLTDLEASRLLMFQTAALLDEGTNASVMAAHAKKFATRVAFTGLSQVMQAMGANGLRLENNIARQLAAAKVCHYTDGTTEIQNVVIGRSLLDS